MNDMASTAASYSTGNRNVTENAENEWMVPILHPIFLLPTDATPTIVDICDCMDKIMGMDRYEYRFCSQTYVPTKEGRALLKESLVRAAKLARPQGLDLVVRSGAGKPTQQGAQLSFTLACDCSIPYLEYKGTVITNGSDGTGTNATDTQWRPAHRCTTTKRILNPAVDGQCKFRLPVYVDSRGYFMRGRMGCNRHSHHPTVVTVVNGNDTNFGTAMTTSVRRPIPGRERKPRQRRPKSDDPAYAPPKRKRRDPSEEWTPLLQRAIELTAAASAAEPPYTLSFGQNSAIVKKGVDQLRELIAYIEGVTTASGATTMTTTSGTATAYSCSP